MADPKQDEPVQIRLSAAGEDFVWLFEVTKQRMLSRSVQVDDLRAKLAAAEAERDALKTVAKTT